MTIYKSRPQRPHSQRHTYCTMKEEITKKSQRKKTAKDNRPLLLFCFTDFEQVFVVGFVYFFFP